MLRPVIMIGCGGSGSKAVRYVRDAVARKLRHAHYQGSIPKAWSFIGLDTLTVQEDPTEIPTLPAEDFLSISQGLNKYSDVHDGLMSNHRNSPETHRYLVGWRPSPHEVAVPLLDGAGQFRAVGRVVGLQSSRERLKEKITQAFMSAQAGGPELGQVSDVLQVPGEPGAATPEPIVVICASMAGGTGAGIALDVVEMVRRTDSLGGYPVLVMFTADIFDFRTNQMAANSLGLVSEVMSAYWAHSSDSILPSVVDKPGNGPHATFFVGRHSLQGSDLGDTVSVYRAVGEAMSTWVTEPKVQEQVQNFITTNWVAQARSTLGGYPFGTEYQSGAVSSFGAATVTLGRDRFERWATHLLARETLEKLAGGHERFSQEYEGETELSEPDLIKALAQRWADAVFEGLSTEGGGLSSANEYFASNEALREEKQNILADLRKPFASVPELTGSEWNQQLKNRTPVSRRGMLRSADQMDAPNWGKKMVRTTCAAISEVAAITSLKVAAESAQITTEKVASLVERLGRQADKDLKQATRLHERARQGWSEQRNKLAFDDPTVEAAFENAAKGLAFEWRSIRLKRTSEILQSASTEVLAPAIRAIRAAANQADEALEQDNVAAWPTNDGGIPRAYRPATTEFPLTQHETWDKHLDELCEMSLPQDKQGTNPVDKVRELIVAGDQDVLEPLLAPARARYRWEPGNTVRLDCDAGSDYIETRIKNWIREQGRFDRFITEGLGDYLKENDPVTGDQRVDHTKRLKSFQTCLEKARNASQPLLQINEALFAEVYGGAPEVDRLCAAFPFQEGHPAAEIAGQVIGRDNFQDTNLDTSSVLISSYIKSPIHPAVVESFTRPVARAVTSYGADAGRFRASFWLWRRSRILERFVPMPPEMFRALIRGFAVGRLCGYVTLDQDRPTISSPDNPVLFPLPLMSRVYPDDMLATLLENFALCYAKVDSDKLRPFKAYQLLYELGERKGTLHSDLIHLIDTGVTRRQTVDTPKVVGQDPESRKQSALTFLQRNIGRLERLASSDALEGDEYRAGYGDAEKDVPTKEIAQVSRDCYQQVYNQVNEGEEGKIA
ncbi:MAG: hypothetical protein OXH10_06355 [bacterium]|nr:hypothetical protein [bacterium]MDE0644312.1 hypothetical protein [bacterium]